MTRLFSRLGLPLLGKELIEQAARKRTYVVRVVYATLLFFAAYLFYYETLRIGTASPLAVLGSGRQMFATLVGLQYAGIVLFMPAMTCGVLTQEKERASLQLLFLTRLGPWTILFEKLTGRLIPMLGFLMLSLPLLAFAYSLGGLTPETLCYGVWLLVVATVQIGTLALACSAFFRTTTGAFIWSYLFGLIMFFGPGFCWLLLWSVTGIGPDVIVRDLGLERVWVRVLTFPFFGPVAFFDATSSFFPIALHTFMALGASGLFLLLARLFVVKRASLAPNNAMLNFFKILDRIFLRLNRNPVTRGFVLVGDTAQLPGNEPVAWRETAKRSLGKAQYLLRVFIAIEIPVAVLCVLIVFGAESGEPLSALLVPVWIVSGLMIAAQAASLIAGERSHQTLDVLCATPLAGQEIVRQKMRAVWRLILVLLVPFYTIFLFEAAMKWRMPTRYFGPNQPHHEFRLGLYLVCSTLSVAVYLPLIAWLSFLIGLKVRTQARAIAGSMATIVAWCAGPLVFVSIPIEILTRGSGTEMRDVANYFKLLSPVTIVGCNESGFRWAFSTFPWPAVFVNFIAYGLVLAVIRRMCLGRVDRLLGRMECRFPEVNMEGIPWRPVDAK